MGLFGSRRPSVQKLKQRGDLTGLRAALRFEDVQLDADHAEWDLGAGVRIEAAEALSGFYGPPVTEGLAEALDDSHPAVRLAAIEGIARLGTPTAVEPLIDHVIAWQDPADGEAGRRALDTLAGWRLEGLPEAFADRLLRPELPYPEAGHAEALGELLAADPREAAARGALAASLVASLHGPRNPDREGRVERILGWLDGPAVDRVVASLDDHGARPAVVRAAGEMGDSRALDPLVELLDRDDVEMRQAAATALGRLNDTTAVPALLVATRDRHRSVRDAASSALNTMGMAAVIVGLGALMQSGELALPGSGPAPARTTLLPSDDEAGPPVVSQPLTERDVRPPLAGSWAAEMVSRLRGEGQES